MLWSKIKLPQYNFSDLEITGKYENRPETCCCCCCCCCCYRPGICYFLLLLMLLLLLLLVLLLVMLLLLLLLLLLSLLIITITHIPGAGHCRIMDVQVRQQPTRATQSILWRLSTLRRWRWRPQYVTWRLPDTHLRHLPSVPSARPDEG